MRDSPTGLAVSLGASFLGFPTHFGFLRRLVEAGCPPSAISGSSSGAIVAGLYAAGVSFGMLEEFLSQHQFQRYFYEWSAPLRAVGTLLGVPGCPAVFRGAALARLLRELVGDQRIESCTTAELHIAVTDLSARRVEIRRHGPLVDTMLASCAMPGLLLPREIEGRLLWDGALGSSVPVEPFVDSKAVCHLMAHSIVFEEQTRTTMDARRYTCARALFAGHQLAADELLHWKLEHARRAGKRVTWLETVTPRPRLGLPLTLPTSKAWPEVAYELMQLGAASAQRWLDDFSPVVEKPAANY